MQIFKQWPIYLVGRIFPAAIGFGAIALYTRMVDPSSFGVYALLLSTSFLVGLIGHSWLRVASLRMMASATPENEANLLATIALSFAAVSVGVCAVCVLIVRLYNPELGWAAAGLTAACAVASSWFELNVAIVQARLQVVAYGVLQMARALGTLVASVGLILAGLKANALLGGFAIGNCAALAAFGIWICAFRGRLDLEILRQVWRFGWPSSAAAFSFLSNTFQRYVLTSVGGSAAVGIYASAGDFSRQTIGLLIGTATLAGQPLAFRARDFGDERQLTEQMRNNARLVFAVALPAAAGVIALAGPISQVYLGPRYHVDSGAVMAITAGVIFLTGMRGSYFEQVFEIALRTRALAANTIVRVILTIVFSLWGISHYGAIGAAVALFLAEAIGLVLSIAWARLLMPVPIPTQSWLKITAATGAMVIAMLLVPGRWTLLGLSAAIVVGTLVYAGSIALMHMQGLRAYVGALRPAAGATRS